MTSGMRNLDAFAPPATLLHVEGRVCRSAALATTVRHNRAQGLVIVRLPGGTSPRSPRGADHAP
jgi:hypothetical protein